jgi:YfiH family protein
MPFYNSENIRYFVFDTFTDAGVVNAVFTRRGGLSPRPWDSLNVGATVGDEFDRVIENRKRSFRALQRPFDSMYDVWQVHGKEVVCAQSPRPPKQKHLQADAIVTDRPEVTIFMRFADCVPIFLFDPMRKVVGLIHAGWRGTIERVAGQTVKVMRDKYLCSTENILAGIGPSIGAHHYEVGSEVEKQVQTSFGAAVSEVLHESVRSGVENGVKFDLWRANEIILEQVGVRRIEVSGICTACHLEDWYSHRAERGRTGRFGALIAL